jgi:hypothetical protein
VWCVLLAVWSVLSVCLDFPRTLHLSAQNKEADSVVGAVLPNDGIKTSHTHYSQHSELNYMNIWRYISDNTSASTDLPNVHSLGIVSTVYNMIPWSAHRYVQRIQFMIFLAKTD